MKKRKLIKIISVVLALVIVGYTVFSYIAASVLFSSVLTNKNPNDEIVPTTEEQLDNELQSHYREWIKAKNTEKLLVKAEDGIDLSAVFIESNSKSDKLFILAHGIEANHTDMIAYAEYISDTYDYNILMPDARAHGESGGDYVGMGVLDKRDYMVWTKYMLEKLGQDTEIAFYSISMGAATIMMLSGEPDIPKQVKFIVADCGFSSIEEEFEYQLKETYHIPKFPILNFASSMAKNKAGYSFDQGSVTDALARSTVPTIVVHGAVDVFVPTFMAYSNYEVINAPKELIIIEGANHTQAWFKDKDGKIKAQIDSYIKSYFS